MSSTDTDISLAIARYRSLVDPWVKLVAWATAGLVMGLALSPGFDFQHTLDAAQQTTGAPVGRQFGSDAGMVLNFIKPEKTADFEVIVARLREALQKSDNPERKEQASSWKVFRAIEPSGDGSVLYVFTVDPAVKGADYTVSGILAEAFPAEVQVLYKQFSESYASGQNFVNLKLVAALGN